MSTCDTVVELTTAGISDEELARLFSQGNEWAFNELMARYGRKILNFINRMIYDRDRAEDLLQETFIRVFRNIDRFDTKRKFNTWLYTIAANLAKNEIRKLRRSPLVFCQSLFLNVKSKVIFDELDKGNRPDLQLYNSQLRELIVRAVEELPESQRQIFILRENEGKSYQEIAEILECNIGTVKSRLNRARTSFARIIEPYLDR